MIEQLWQQFKIEHRNLVPYRPQMNGAVEAANKNIKKILVKMIDTYKDWHEFFPFALCTNRVSLVNDMEAVLFVEVEIPSLRILSQTKLSEDEWACSWYEQLNLIDEKRMIATQSLWRRQPSLERA